MEYQQSYEIASRKKIPKQMTLTAKKQHKQTQTKDYPFYLLSS